MRVPKFVNYLDYKQFITYNIKGRFIILTVIYKRQARYKRGLRQYIYKIVFSVLYFFWHYSYFLCKILAQLFFDFTRNMLFQKYLLAQNGDLNTQIASKVYIKWNRYSFPQLISYQFFTVNGHLQ